MSDLIPALEQELASSLARVAAVQACLDALRLGAPSGRTITASHARGRTAERRGRSGPRPRGKGKASTTTTDASVLAAIKAGHGTTKALIAKTALPAYNVTQALKRLVAAKQVTKTGATSSRRYEPK